MALDDMAAHSEYLHLKIKAFEFFLAKGLSMKHYSLEAENYELNHRRCFECRRTIQGEGVLIKEFGDKGRISTYAFHNGCYNYFSRVIIDVYPYHANKNMIQLRWSDGATTVVPVSRLKSKTPFR